MFDSESQSLGRRTDLKQEIFRELERNELRCARCKLVIPFVYERGEGFTCPSFTIFEGEPVCYYCYHPQEYVSKRLKRISRS